MTVIFLCTTEELVRERKGYADAFRELGLNVVCSGDVTYLEKVLSGIKDKVIGIIKPEPPSSVHPIDLLNFDIPCASFEFDTYTRTPIRAKASSLFDFQFVCHPGYESTFEKLGASFPVLLPWCVDAKLIDLQSTVEKQYDIGWVGRTDGKFYSTRRSILALLQDEFKLNDSNRHYDWHEMIKVYQQSKIVVNISRDDFLIDANMRCFEAMGAGALLITHLPTELLHLGFKQEEHFIGYHTETDLIEKIKYYLKNPDERNKIVKSGQALVLNNHTYLHRAEQIIKIFETCSESAKKKNPFRTNTDINATLKAIAYGHWKDGNLNKMLYVLQKMNKIKTPGLALKAFTLFLKKIK